MQPEQAHLISISRLFKHRETHVSFLTLRGAGRPTTAHDFRSLLCDAGDRSPYLLLDLSELDYLSSSGLGLLLERGETMDEAIGALEVVAEFRRRFEEEMGSIHCRDLTGVDLTTEEGIEQLVGSDIPQTACFPAVSTAYQLVTDLLEESG